MLARIVGLTKRGGRLFDPELVGNDTTEAHPRPIEPSQCIGIAIRTASDAEDRELIEQYATSGDVGRRPPDERDEAARRREFERQLGPGFGCRRIHDQAGTPRSLGGLRGTRAAKAHPACPIPTVFVLLQKLWHIPELIQNQGHHNAERTCADDANRRGRREQSGSTVQQTQCHHDWLKERGGGIVNAVRDAMNGGGWDD